MVTFNPHDWSTVVSTIGLCDRTIPKIPSGFLDRDRATGRWYAWSSVYENWIEAPDHFLTTSVYCLDVETSVSNRYLALASMYDMVNKRWFAWLQPPEGDDLLSIPDGSLIIAHRSCFEASFIQECYTMHTKTRFLDTHTMAAVQIHPTDENLCRAKPHLPMFREASPLGLADLYKWATNQEMDKSDVDIFIKATKTSFYEHLEVGFKYNYTDVKNTIVVFWKLWDNYAKMPEPFVAGLLARSIPLMILAPDWYAAVDRIEACFQEHNNQIQTYIDEMVAERICAPGYDGHDDLDCKVWGKTAKGGKAGMPKWWDKTKITVGSSTIAVLSQLTWNNRPIVRTQQDLADKKKDGTPKQIRKFYTVDRDREHLEAIINKSNPVYLDNPNNTGDAPKAIASFFGKNFLQYWMSGVLSGKPQAIEIAKLFVKTTFWRSIRSRVNSMLVRSTAQGLMNVPLTLTAGTITNRAVDPFWLVLSKLDPDKIGSELMGQVKAPKGFKIVYADFDSVQAVIAGAISDMFTAKEKGERKVTMCSNEFSKSCLLGNKADRSTLAYKIADGAGIDYAQGKAASYALLFGCGANKLGAMLGNSTLGTQIVNSFKGKRVGSEYVGGLASIYFNGVVGLSNGLYSIAGRWSRSSRISTVFLGRELSASIAPGVRLENFITTANNAVVQSVDVDFLCFITWTIEKNLAAAGIKARFGYSIHDCVYYYVEENRTEEAVEIFQQSHTETYLAFLEAINADVSTFPQHLLRFSGVDVSDRILKDSKDTGVTISNPQGYLDEDDLVEIPDFD